MDGWIWGLVGALAALLLVAALALLVQARARRRDRAAVAGLREEVELLAARLGPAVVRAPGPGPAERSETEFLITRVGEAPDEVGRPVGDRVVLSTTLGEPLVRVLALGHGLRRALAPETRNRIGFEVRREIKRSRKNRRREMRDAWREKRTRREPVEPDPARSPGLDAGLDVA